MVAPLKKMCRIRCFFRYEWACQSVLCIKVLILLWCCVPQLFYCVLLTINYFCSNYLPVNFLKCLECMITWTSVRSYRRLRTCLTLCCSHRVPVVEVEVVKRLTSSWVPSVKIFLKRFDIIKVTFKTLFGISKCGSADPSRGYDFASFFWQYWLMSWYSPYQIMWVDIQC